MKETIGAFVSNTHVDPIEVSESGGERRSWLGGYPSITLHTGEDTWRVPWRVEGPVPRVGTNVTLTIEWED